MPKKKGRVPYTEQMKQVIKTHRERTGWGPWALHRLVKEIDPDITPNQVLHIAYTDSAFTVKQGQYNAVLEAYKNIPASAYRSDRYDILSDKKIPVPPAFIEKLDQLINSQIGMTGLLKRNPPPKGLSVGTLSRIRMGHTKTIKQEHYDFLMMLFGKS